jgi:hypothetical protein
LPAVVVACVVLAGCEAHAGTPVADGTGAPAPIPSVTPRGPVPCLSSQRHFDTDADLLTATVCLPAGGVLDVTTLQAVPEPVTSVVSSEPAIVACGDPRPDLCRATGTGQSVVTVTDGGGTWRVLVYAGR